MHNSTHSSQMKTVGPAINFLTSCWLLPQKEQYNIFLLLLIEFKTNQFVYFIIFCVLISSFGFNFA